MLGVLTALAGYFGPIQQALADAVTDTYFRARIDERRALAQRAAHREDRVFWEEAGRRWQRVLGQYSRHAAPRLEVRQAPSRKFGGRSRHAA